MRASTARLTNLPVRLADLAFPRATCMISRTRLAFIHLDNLLSWAKRDRDGRVDGFLAAYLPDECLLLFFRKGEAVSAASLHSAGREVVTITEALRRMRAEVERGEVAYCAAPMEQLAWMYQSCAAPAQPRFVDVAQKSTRTSPFSCSTSCGNVASDTAVRVCPAIEPCTPSLVNVMLTAYARP